MRVVVRVAEQIDASQLCSWTIGDEPTPLPVKDAKSALARLGDSVLWAAS